MMSVDEIQRLPKLLRIDLYKTAQSIGYDDHVALTDVRTKLYENPRDAALLEEEARVLRKLDNTCEWMRRLSQAIGDTRPSFVRILLDNLIPDDA